MAASRPADPVRVGLIGLGAFGRYHARWISELPELQLVATCDRMTNGLDGAAGVTHFTEADELIRSGLVEAVLIASPHHTHAAIATESLGVGLHVLLEKPVARHLAEAQALVALQRQSGQQIAVMLNQRMNPVYQTAKDVLARECLGNLQRVTWICTPWYRTEAYYRSAAWRGTWAGEGGGLLTTLCLHQLDILQWLCGLPQQVHAHCAFGKYHDIEVEDEVSAHLSFKGGATGVFIGSSAETPGTNRLELVGTGGRLLIDDGKCQLEVNAVRSDEFSKSSTDGWARPTSEVVQLEASRSSNLGEHSWVLRNFARAIRGLESLATPASEGLPSLELAGAMLLSAFRQQTVSLPLDAGALAAELHLRER